jgi:hypothetical protein
MPGRRIFDLIEIPDQLWLRADAPTRCTKPTDQGGSSPLSDYPASTGTRRERYASPMAMACGHSRQNPAESRRL